MQPNDPTPKPLYDVGWGTPSAGDIVKPLEDVGQTLAEITQQVASNIEDKLRVIHGNMSSLAAKLQGYLKAQCEECQVALDHCHKMVGARIEDKLLCVRHAIDQVCDKCPEAKAIVFGALQDSPLAMDILDHGLAEPVSVGAVSVPGSAVSISAVSSPTQPEPLQSLEPPPIQPLAQQNVQQFPGGMGVGGQAINLGGPAIVQPQFGAIAPPIPGAIKPAIVGGREFCLWAIPPNPAIGINFYSQCAICSRDCRQDLLPRGSVMVECSRDPNVISSWNAKYCNPTGQQPPTGPTQPPTQPTQPAQCVVCNQCQPTPTPCPACPKPRFCAWRNQDATLCYLLPEGSPPQQQTDTKLDCSDDVQSLSSLISSQCSSNSTQTQPSQVQPIEIGSGQLLCNLLAYKPGGQISQFVAAGAVAPLQLLLFGQPGSLDQALKNAIADCKSGSLWEKIWGCIKEPFLQAMSQIDGFLTGSLKKTGCTSPAFLDATLARIIWQFVEKYICSDIPQISQPIRYVADANCPVMFPSAAEASQAWLRGQISDDVYRTWVIQNNFCFEPWHQITLANSAFFNPVDAVQAYRRNLIAQGEYDRQIRANRWLTKDAPQLWLDLTKFVPPISDLVRFMVRDVEDPNIYNTFDLDKFFTDKWQGQTKVWGNQQGIDDDTAKRYWRAHWTIPSPSQLFDMYHRSRGLDSSDPVYVGIDTLKTALQYQDIAPYWVDRLLNTTYALLRIVDIRRAYEFGSLDESGVYRQFVMRGYTDDDAAIITNYYAKQKQLALLRNPAVKLFEKGEISAGEMEARIRDLGANDDTVARAYNDAQQKLLRSRVVKLYESWQTTEGETRDSLSVIGAAPATIDYAIKLGRRVRFKSSRMRCLNAIRKRFIFGELLATDTRTILSNSGASAEEIDELIPLWECEKAARGKELSASQLCKMFEQGLINERDMVLRLQRLGYSDSDALLVAANCGIVIAQRQQIAADKKAAKAKQVADKLAKQFARDAQQAARDTERAKKAAEAAEKARQAREQRLEGAIASLARMTETTITDAGTLLRRLWQDISKQYSLVPDERITVIVRAIERGRPKTLGDAETLIIELANESDMLSSVIE